MKFVFPFADFKTQFILVILQFAEQFFLLFQQVKGFLRYILHFAIAVVHLPI